MKTLQSHFFRALAAIVAGILIVEFRQDMMRWITIAVGILFLLSGIISLIAYFSARSRKAAEPDASAKASGPDGNTGDSQKRPSFPLVGLGSLILGLILALMNSTFLNYVMLVLAAILIIGGINQLFNLITARKYAHIGFGWWLFPCVILLCGFFVIVKALTTALTAALAASLLLLLGWSLMLYGVVECINALKIMLVKRKALKLLEAQNKQEASNTQEPVGSRPQAEANSEKPLPNSTDSSKE